MASPEFNQNAIVKEELKFGKIFVFKRTTNLENQFTEIDFLNKEKTLDK